MDSILSLSLFSALALLLVSLTIAGYLVAWRERETHLSDVLLSDPIRQLLEAALPAYGRKWLGLIHRFLGIWIGMIVAVWLGHRYLDAQKLVSKDFLPLLVLAPVLFVPGVMALVVCRGRRQERTRLHHFLSEAWPILSVKLEQLPKVAVKKSRGFMLPYPIETRLEGIHSAHSAKTIRLTYRPLGRTADYATGRLLRLNRKFSYGLPSGYVFLPDALLEKLSRTYSTTQKL